MKHCLLVALTLSTVAHAAPAKKPSKRAAPVAKPAAPTALAPKLDVVLPVNAVAPAELIPMPKDPAQKPSGAISLVAPAGPLPAAGAVTFSPDSKSLLVGRHGGVVRWDLETGKVVQVLSDVPPVVHALEFSPDGTTLAVAGGKNGLAGEVWLYDVAQGYRKRSALVGHTDIVYGIDWSPDGKRLASASFDKTANMYDVATGKVAFSVKDHSDFVYDVAFSPDGKRLATCSKDRAVKLTNAETGKSEKTLSGHNQDVVAVTFNTEGQFLVSSGYEPNLRWWSVDSGQARSTGGHGARVHEIRLSRDRKTMISAGADGFVRLWDAASGAGKQNLQVPGGEWVYSADQSPNGHWVAGGTWDGLVRLWHAATGRLLLTLVAPSSPEAEWLAVTPEGYFDTSPYLAKQLRFRVGREPSTAETLRTTLHKGEMIPKALKVEVLPPVQFVPATTAK